MERQISLPVNVATSLLQSFPGSTQLDAVVVTVFDVNDNATDVNAVAMTAIGNESWSYAWTPTDSHIYLVKFYNPFTDVAFYLYINVTGSSASTPSGGTGGSTLTVLRTRFLKLIDNYNALDLTGTNSSGEIADLCLNDALQLIYSQIKATRHMEAYASTLVTTSGVSYVALSGIADLDEIRAVRDTTNMFTLQAISAYKYFLSNPDPDNITGTPFLFTRIFNRIYFAPQPTAAITYAVDYIKTYPRLALDSDQALIPSKFDDWIIKEAKVIWYTMEDAQNVPQLVLNERNEAREIYMNDMFSDFDSTAQVSSNFGRQPGMRGNRYDWNHA